MSNHYELNQGWFFYLNSNCGTKRAIVIILKITIFRSYVARPNVKYAECYCYDNHLHNSEIRTALLTKEGNKLVETVIILKGPA